MTLKAETEDLVHTGKKGGKKPNPVAIKISARWNREKNTTQQGFQSNGQKNAYQSQEKNKNKENLNKEQE